MPKEKILDAAVKIMKPSNQKYITRYHTTQVSNVPSIVENGLSLNYVGDGFGKYLFNNRLNNGVFTSSKPTYMNGDGQVTIELKIPKKYYKNLKRDKHNLEFIPDDGRNYRLNSDIRDMHTIQDNGRTDIFLEDLNPTWIKKIVNGNGLNQSKYSKKKFINLLNCDPSDISKGYRIQAECSDFLNDLNLLGSDENTGELVNMFEMEL